MLKERIDALSVKTEMNDLRSTAEWIEAELKEIIGTEVGYKEFFAKISGIQTFVSKIDHKVAQIYFYFEVEGSDYLKSILEKEHILRLLEVPGTGVVFEFRGTGNFLCKFNEELFLARMCTFLVNFLK